LKEKLENLIEQINKLPHIIIDITETILKETYPSDFNEYKFLQSNSITNAGGVGMFLRDDVNFP